MTKNATYCDKHVSSRKCIFFVVEDAAVEACAERSTRVHWFGCGVRLLSPQNNRGSLQKNTLPWWYVFVTVGHVFCHACTSMTNLWQNQDSHTCAIVEVLHDITKIIIMEVFISMTINAASWKCFCQGWPTRGIHRNGSPLSYWVRFWIR